MGYITHLAISKNEQCYDNTSMLVKRCYYLHLEKGIWPFI